MMKHKHLAPVYLALAVAFGVLLGIIISRSNNANKTFINRGSDMNLVDKVFYLLENEYVDTVDVKKLEVEAVNTVIDKMDPHSEYFEPEVLEEVNASVYDDSLTGRMTEKEAPPSGRFPALM